MHGKRDQSRSVNVLRLAALTLVMPLRFIVHVGRFMCAHVCVFKWEGEQLPVIDWGRKRVCEDVTNFHWKFTSHCKKINKQMKKLLSLICTHIRIYCYDHKPSHKKNHKHALFHTLTQWRTRVHSTKPSGDSSFNCAHSSRAIGST